jgi:hypothetical protein
MYCVIIPNPVTATLSFGDHHLRLDSLMQAELADLLARIEAGAADTIGGVVIQSTS